MTDPNPCRERACTRDRIHQNALGEVTTHALKEEIDKLRYDFTSLEMLISLMQQQNDSIQAILSRRVRDFKDLLLSLGVDANDLGDTERIGS